MGKRTYIIVHHTGAEEKDAAQIKRYHLSLGWRDVGYNYIIERCGRVVEGRPLDVPGAHCRAGGMNYRGIGVTLIGNLDFHPPTRQQVEALPALLKKLMGEYEIPPHRVLGHREVPGAITVCPGRFVDMAALRTRVGGAAGPEPASPGLWRVQAGAFKSREAAERRVQKLHSLGIDAFVVPPD